MKLSLVVILWGSLCGSSGCARPPAPPNPTPTPSDVYTELVEAGCIAPSDDGVQSIAEQHALHDTTYLECLFEGGTVSSCSVPCR